MPEMPTRMAVPRRTTAEVCRLRLSLLENKETVKEVLLWQEARQQ